MSGKQVIVALVIFFTLVSDPANAFSVNSLKIDVQDNGGVYMNDMSKLTEDEFDLISSLVSNPGEYDKNLLKQRDKIKDLKEEADYCYQYYGITGVDSKHINRAIIIKVVAE